MSREQAIHRSKIKVIDIDTGRIELIARGAKTERQAWLGEIQTRLCVRDRKTGEILIPYIHQYDPKKHEHPLDYFKGTFR